MKVIKKIGLLLCLATLTATSMAQEINVKDFSDVRVLLETEDENTNRVYGIIALENDSASLYFLSLGNLGIGNKVIQVHLDPLSELYIYLGNTLTESLARIDELIEQIKSEPGTTTETLGYIGLGVPDEYTDTVTITTRKPLLSRHLQFSVQSKGFIRSTDIGQTQLKSLRLNLKLYKKIHKKRA